MKLQTAQEIIECLPQGHTPFQYSKDDYAFYMLNRATERMPMRVDELKKSSYAPLVNKPKVKDFLSQTGTNTLTSDMTQYAMGCSDITKFNLTLGTWGPTKHMASRWTQTTRGKMNLVLQLNWDTKRVKQFQKQSRDWIGGVHYGGMYHPIARDQHTLAWARIDCDLDTGEALIEEIQSDWIRGFSIAENYISKLLRDKDEHEMHLAINRYFKQESYIIERLKKAKKLWAEATLLAAIQFIRQDLGIENIFYHAFESGCALKRISSSLPPRSLYTDLPKKFCMKKSAIVPEFLENDRYFNRQRNKLKIPVEFFQLPPNSPQTKTWGN